MLSGAVALGVMIVLTVIAVVSVAGIGGQSASGRPVSAVRAVQVRLCDALIKALPSTMAGSKISSGYDANTKAASCTAVDPRYNAVTLYQLVPIGVKANKAAFQANVRQDMGIDKPGYGCSASDQGQLDTSPQNTIPGTKRSYGCNMMVGAGNIGTRVDALTTGNRSVSFSIACDPATLRDQSAIMVAQKAIKRLA